MLPEHTRVLGMCNIEFIRISVTHSVRNGGKVMSKTRKVRRMVCSSDGTKRGEVRVLDAVTSLIQLLVAHSSSRRILISSMHHISVQSKIHVWTTLYDNLAFYSRKTPFFVSKCTRTLLLHGTLPNISRETSLESQHYPRPWNS